MSKKDLTSVNKYRVIYKELERCDKFNVKKMEQEMKKVMYVVVVLMIISSILMSYNIKDEHIELPVGYMTMCRNYLD